MSMAEVWEISDDDGFTTHAYQRMAVKRGIGGAGEIKGHPSDLLQRRGQEHDGLLQHNGRLREVDSDRCIRDRLVRTGPAD